MEYRFKKSVLLFGSLIFLTYIASGCFQKCSIFIHFMCLEKQAQDNSNLYVALTQPESGAQYFPWQMIAVLGTFFIPSWIKDETSFRWGTNECGTAEPSESSPCCGGGRPAANQSFSAPASVRPGSPECRAYRKPGQFDWVPVIDCFFCGEQVSARLIFFPASCQNTDCTELHTQALKAPPTLSTPNTHLSSNGKHAISDKQLKVPGWVAAARTDF